MSGAAAAVGTAFKVGTYAIGKLKSIAGVEISADIIDVTTLDNADGYREFIAGFKDGAEIPMSGYYTGDDAGQAMVLTKLEARTLASCSITFPTAISASWAFNGLVTKFATGFDVDGAVMFDAAVKPSGKPTLTT